ncbi:MAG: FtsX-like permease family protein [Pirellulales bacterium]|nr:FtsX-like permease family protein [Pirellulales bacterium]
MVRTTGLIFRELLFRRTNMLLTISVLAVAVAICVALAMTHVAAERETRRVALTMGYNLRIIPSATDENAFFLRGYSDQFMPVDVVHRLAKHNTIAYNHLVATLQQEITLQGTTAILTGLGDALYPPGKEKPPIRSQIKPGTVEVGHLIGKQLRLEEGATVDLDSIRLRIVRIAPPTGTRDDMGLFVQLSDAQTILDKPDLINEIQAMDCLCQTTDHHPQEAIRREIQRIAPEAKVVMLQKIADARTRQRRMIERVAAFAMPLLLAGSAIWVGALAMLNVRQRQNEIGLLKALGYRGATVAWLFLGRAILLGLVAAIVGYAIGTALGLGIGPTLFPVTAKSIQAQHALAGWALLATPLLAALASLFPATLASTQDPADVLRAD